MDRPWATRTRGFFAARQGQAVSCVKRPRLFLFRTTKKENDMVNVKCFYCGKSFALDMDAVAAWLQEHQEEKPKHYAAQCHFCRRAIKVPVQQIRRNLPTVPDPSQPT